MASTPNIEELDDVIFGVSTRHQWNQLISQIEATNLANRGRGKPRKNNKNILLEKNNEVYCLSQEIDQKGKPQVIAFAFNACFFQPGVYFISFMSMNQDDYGTTPTYPACI